MSKNNAVVQLITPVVFDIKTFSRTAYWISRTKLPPGSVFWSVVVDGEYADVNEVKKCLVNYRNVFRSRLTEVAAVKQDDDGFGWQIAEDFCPAGAEVRCVLASDALLLPDVLPAVMQEVEENLENVVVCRQERITPADVLNLDFCGSNFIAKRVMTTPFVHSRTEEALLAAWCPGKGFAGDPEMACDQIVYSQLGREDFPGWDRKRYMVLSTAGSHEEFDIVR